VRRVMLSMWMTVEEVEEKAEKKAEKAEKKMEMKIERRGGKEDVRRAPRARGYVLGIT